MPSSEDPFKTLSSYTEEVSKNPTTIPASEGITHPLFTSPHPDPISFPEKDTDDKDWERIGETVSFIEKNLLNQKLHDEWYAKYIYDPHIFFNSENFQEIRKIDPKMRALFLVKNCTLLSVRTSEVENYFDAFPEDFEAIHELLLERDYSPDTSAFFDIFGVSARYIATRFPNLKNTYRSFNQYLEIADRRDLAPDFLLEGTTEVDAREKYARFGKAAEGFRKTYKEAVRLSQYGDTFLDTEQMVTPEYEALPIETKREFLHECLRELQLSLVFEEANNSAFTKEHVEKDRRQAKQYSSAMYNSAHSMLYKTYQPSSVYEYEQNFYTRHMNQSASIGGHVEEFPFHRLLITILKEIERLPSNTETSNLLVDFWNKNRNPLFGNPVVDALSKHEPAHAAKKILQHIRQEKDNVSLASILYRLELGRIGISAHGTKYLEKLYDLGELNNPAYCAERLTALGDIGIFDEQKKLLGYFNLGNIISDEDVVKSEVLEITKDLLFHLTGKETDEELAEREKILYEFTTKYHDFFGKEWLSEAGIRFNNLSFGEQGWFMQYARQQQWVDSPEKFERDKRFFKTFGETGIRCFLSLEQGMHGDKIVDIGLGLPSHIAEKIFLKYTDLVKQQENLENYINQNGKKTTRNHTAEATVAILVRAKQLLVSFSEQMEEFQKASPEQQTKMATEILEGLDAINADTELFRTVFKTMKENGEDVSFEDFQDLDWQTALAPEQISAQDQWQMKKIYMENYQSPTYTPEFRSELLSGLDARFQNPNCRFYLLKHKDGSIIGFNAFHNTEQDKEGREHIYFGAFNISPQFGQSKLGETILDTTLGVEGANKITDAHCDSRSPISDKYLRSGFVATGFKSISGSPSFSITRDTDLNRILLTKRTAKTMTLDVLEQLSKGGSPREYIQVVKLQNNTFPTEYFKQGFVLSHYRFGKGGVRYAVFEKPQSRKIGNKSNETESPLLLAA